MATDGGHGHRQHRPVSGDFPDCGADGDSLVEPAEPRVRAPGLAAHQRGVSHVDADGDVVHGLWETQADKDKYGNRWKVWRY